MRDYLPFFGLLLLVAVLFRDDAVFLVLYLLLGVFVAGRWWSGRALAAIRVERRYTDHIFLGESVAVQVRVTNTSLLPVVWLQLRESVPPEVAGRRALREVVSLGPRGEVTVAYELQPHKRGYYQLGPLTVTSGDVLGLGPEDERAGGVTALTVYPRIRPLRRLALPSQSPLGTLRHTRPIFEDPARVVGRREYAAGDSLRRVDWKATAASGRLQVKLLEPSIALETVIVLGFGHADYDARSRYDASELAVVAAASIANWVAGQRQAVGLLTNGQDPLAQPPAAVAGPAAGSVAGPAAVTARKGRRSLMTVLEVLARVELAEAAPPLANFLGPAAASLAWGTSLVLVTGRMEEALLAALLPLRRAGLRLVIVLVGPAPRVAEWRARAATVGVVLHAVAHERDLEGWAP